MDEQSPTESQPKVRRAGSGGAEEPRPSAPRAGRTSQAEQEAPENASEKLLRAGESQAELSPVAARGGLQNRQSFPLLSMSHVHAIIFTFFSADVILALSYLVIFLFGINPFGKTEPVLFDLGAEGSIPSWYSAMKLLLVGLCAYFYGRLIFLSDRIAGALILLCAAGFGYLSMDEGAALHEKLGSNIDKLVIGGKLAFGNPFPVTGLWMAYLAPPLFLALVAGVVYLRKRLSIPTGIFIKAIAGIVTFIAAAASDIFVNFVTPLTKPLQVATEEFGEMVGVTLILWAVMTLLAQQDATVVGGATAPARSSVQQLKS